MRHRTARALHPPLHRAATDGPVYLLEEILPTLTSNVGVRMNRLGIAIGDYSSSDTNATFTPKVEVFSTLTKLQNEVNALQANTLFSVFQVRLGGVPIPTLGVQITPQTVALG